MASLITAPASNTTEPIYFETSWSVLSSIGLMNVLYGGLVIGITNLSPITIVPIIVSAACTVANGMCYYSFYGDYQRIPSLVAGIVADLMWLIQEAGLSFYSYQILRNILQNRDRRIFLGCFWTIMTVIVLIRMSILVTRALDNLHGNSVFQKCTSDLHIAYFIAIALVEFVSSIFLLRVFASAKRSALVVSSQTSLFRHLTRSTEIRLATLSLIGLTRAVTYSFQNSAQKATSVASQVDRFVYTLECLFPVLLMIDIMGSKLVSAELAFQNLPTRNHRQTMNRPPSGLGHDFSFPNSDRSDDHTPFKFFGGRKLSSSSNSSRIPMHSAPGLKTVITAGRQAGSSQEWIMDDLAAQDRGHQEDILKTAKDARLAVHVDKTIQFEHVELYQNK